MTHWQTGPSQQHGSTVALAASSRIEASRLGGRLVFATPTHSPDLSLAEDFLGPPIPTPKLDPTVEPWSCTHTHWTHQPRRTAAKLQRSKDHPRNMAALSRVSTSSPTTTQPHLASLRHAPQAMCCAAQAGPCESIVSDRERDITAAPWRDVSQRSTRHAEDQGGIQIPKFHGRIYWLISKAILHVSIHRSLAHCGPPLLPASGPG